jgi:hypothetical protein
MANDRFVRWGKTRPSRIQLRAMLEGYVGGSGSVTQEGERLFASLPGKPSSPFRGLEGFDNIVASQTQREERFFEVFVDKKYADVITRQTDPLTNAVADGFASLICRFFNGEMK